MDDPVARGAATHSVGGPRCNALRGEVYEGRTHVWCLRARDAFGVMLATQTTSQGDRGGDAMIANQDSTPDTMKKALTYTIAALVAAAELDGDRSADDRAFFQREHDALTPVFHRVSTTAAAVETHTLTVGMRAQVRVVVGDAVLDRGVRDAKARMKLELKNSAMPGGADHVFPSDVRDLTEAEARNEPALVLQVAQRFAQVPEYHQKSEQRQMLEERARKQKENLDARDAADLAEATLKGAQRLAIRDGADALYRLEKRMLERFPREAKYVREFFYDTAPVRKEKKAAAPAPGPAPAPAPVPPRSSQNPPPA